MYYIIAAAVILFFVGYLLFRLHKRYLCGYCNSRWSLRYTHFHSNGGGLGPGGTDFYRKCTQCNAEEHRRDIINIGSLPWKLRV